MAKVAQRICPACGARNKPNREFCVRCEESLVGVEIDAGKSAGPDIEINQSSSQSSGIGLWSWGLMIAAVVTAVWFWVNPFKADKGPDPAFFSGLRPPAPTPNPLPVDQAALDFDEGNRLLAAGDVNAAIVKLRSAIARRPNVADYHYRLAQALVAARQDPVQEYEQAARLDPRNIEYVLSVARALYGVGRQDDAESAFQKVLAAQPNSIEALRDLGALYLHSGKSAQALEVYRRAAAAAPSDTRVLEGLGRALTASGDKQGAVGVFRDMLARQPGDQMTRTLLAHNLSDGGNNAEALSLLEEGLRSSPDAPLLLRSMGAMLERAGRASDAAAAYRKYAELTPNASDAAGLKARADAIEQRAQSAP